MKLDFLHIIGSLHNTRREEMLNSKIAWRETFSIHTLLWLIQFIYTTLSSFIIGVTSTSNHETNILSHFLTTHQWTLWSAHMDLTCVGSHIGLDLLPVEQLQVKAGDLVDWKNQPVNQEEQQLYTGSYQMGWTKWPKLPGRLEKLSFTFYEFYSIVCGLVCFVG